MRNIERTVVALGAIISILGAAVDAESAVKKGFVKKMKAPISYSKVAFLAKQSSRALLKNRPTSVIMKQLSKLTVRERRIHGYLTGVVYRRALDQQQSSVGDLMVLAASLDMTTEARARVMAGTANTHVGAIMDIYDANPQLQQLVGEDRLDLLPGIREGIELPDAPQIDVINSIQQNVELQQTIRDEISDISSIFDEIYQNRTGDFEIANGQVDDIASAEFDTWLVDVALGATIAGVKSYLVGDGFWAGVADYLVDEMVDYVRGAIVSWAEEHADDGGFTGLLATAILWVDAAIDFFTGDDGEEEDEDSSDYYGDEADDCFTKVEIPDGPGDYGDSSDGEFPIPGPMEWPWPGSDQDGDADEIVCGVNPNFTQNLIAQRQIALDTMASMLLYQAQATKY